MVKGMTLKYIFLFFTLVVSVYGQLWRRNNGIFKEFPPSIKTAIGEHVVAPRIKDEDEAKV